MDTQFAETLETHSKPPDSVDLHQTLGGSSPNLPPFPPTETLDDFELSDLSDSPFQDDDDDDNEEEEEDDIDGLSLRQLLDIESPREEKLEDDKPLMVSPINTYSGGFTSRWYSDWSDPGPSIPSKSHFLQPWDMGSGSVSPVWVDEKRATVGAGLQNLGNTCFLNAVMQCFTHMVPLVQGLLYSDHPIPCDRNSYGFCVLCAFRRHIEVSLTSTCRDVSPWNFVDNLRYFSSNFQRYQQEDAHEFLQCFLDRLDSCSDTKPKDFTLAASDDSLVKQTFGGCLVSKLKCCNCGHFSFTYEPSIDLSLEIEDVTTLQAALESFTKVEKIEDQETKFSCENCNQEVSIEKQLVLDQTPIVTSFHLKRFKNYGSYVEKIDKCVEFPLELDLLPYATNSQDTTVDLKYDLYAVVVHIGFSSTSGHYFCFIRSAPDTWFKFDDSKVVMVSEDFVLSQEAYILFYAKQGTQWFSSYFETLKPFLDSHFFNTSPKSVLDNLDTVTSSSSHATNQNHDVNETSDAGNEVRTETPNELINEQGGGSKYNVDVHRISTIVPLDTSNSLRGTFNVEEVCEPSVLQANSLNHNDVKINSGSASHSPPGSPSPDIYKEHSPEVGVTIKCDHLNLGSQLPCKRQLKKKWESPETKEAHRYLRSMPSTRSRSLLVAMERPHSEGSHNKRRRRMEVSPLKDDTPLRTRRSVELKSTWEKTVEIVPMYSVRDEEMMAQTTMKRPLAQQLIDHCTSPASIDQPKHIVIIMDGLKNPSMKLLKWVLKNKTLKSCCTVTLLAVMPWLNIPLSCKIWSDEWMMTIQGLCRKYGVIPQVKILMGFPLRSLIAERIANLNTNLVVIDRHHSRRYIAFYASKIPCNIVAMNDDGEFDVIKVRSSMDIEDFSSPGELPTPELMIADQYRKVLNQAKITKEVGQQKKILFGG